MKILALDQSTKLTGISVWENNRLIKHFVFDTNVKENAPFLRLKRFKEFFDGLLDEEKPNVVCFEGVQFQNNYNTYMRLANLQGIILASLFERNIDFEIVTSSKWRKHFGIKGRKREEYKAHTIEMIEEKFGFSCTDDEADAVAIGLWYVDEMFSKKRSKKNENNK